MGEHNMPSLTLLVLLATLATLMLPLGIPMLPDTLDLQLAPYLLVTLPLLLLLLVVCMLELMTPPSPMPTSTLPLSPTFTRRPPPRPMLMSRFLLSLTSILSLSRPPLLLLLQLLPMLLPQLMLLPLWVMLLPLWVMLVPLLVMLLPLLVMLLPLHLPWLLLLATPLLPQLIPTPPTHTPFKSRFYTLLLSILHFGLENRDTSRHKTGNVTRRSFRVTT